MLSPTPRNFILFLLDLDVKFPLLCLLLFLIDLKSIISCQIILATEEKPNKKKFESLNLTQSKSFDVEIII